MPPIDPVEERDIEKLLAMLDDPRVLQKLARSIKVSTISPHVKECLVEPAMQNSAIFNGDNLVLCNDNGHAYSGAGICTTCGISVKSESTEKGK